MRPWNAKVKAVTFWDTDTDGGKGREVFQVRSLKDTLMNPAVEGSGIHHGGCDYR